MRKALIGVWMHLIFKIKALSEMEVDKNNVPDGIEFYVMHSTLY